ncbi:MAG: VOC family protein [Verrucomicrobiales bacterium]
MKFSEIAFTVYPALDLEASRHFYEKILGLEPTMVSEHGNEGDGWIEYEIGGQVLAIGKTEGMKPSADGASVGLECVDYEGTLEALRAAGVSFLMEPFETPVCRMALISDPAGNTLIIHQRKPGHA